MTVCTTFGIVKIISETYILEILLFFVVQGIVLRSYQNGRRSLRCQGCYQLVSKLVQG
jgi:hypothetical protein